jgi:DNA-binding transcriptional ArsR family regulator
MAKYNNTVKSFITITKALSDAHRVSAIRYLCEGELCLCQLIEMLELAPSTVSKHMSILYQAGLVETRKQGRWIYYRLPDEQAEPEIQQTIHWARNYLTADQFEEELKKLEVVRKTNREELCSHYKK